MQFWYRLLLNIIVWPLLDILYNDRLAWVNLALGLPYAFTQRLFLHILGVVKVFIVWMCAVLEK